MKSVDDVSLGMGGAADTLFISAKSGDEGLLSEQTKSIQTLASSLHDIAHDSVERYDKKHCSSQPHTSSIYTGTFLHTYTYSKL